MSMTREDMLFALSGIVMAVLALMIYRFVSMGIMDFYSSSRGGTLNYSFWGISPDTRSLLVKAAFAYHVSIGLLVRSLLSFKIVCVSFFLALVVVLPAAYFLMRFHPLEGPFIFLPFIFCFMVAAMIRLFIGGFVAIVKNYRSYSSKGEDNG